MRTIVAPLRSKLGRRRRWLRVPPEIVDRGRLRRVLDPGPRRRGEHMAVEGADLHAIAPRSHADPTDATLSAIEKTESEIRDQISRGELLRQSILKKAFSGRLVAQDPNDEPASVLLERIQAEKDGPSKRR